MSCATRTHAGRLFLVGLLIVAAGVLGACGEPPELREADRKGTPTRTPVPTLPSNVTPGPALPPLTPAPSSSTFPEYLAVDCQGRPSSDQVIALLRRESHLLPRGARITVRASPRCSGDWQYTVIEVNGREPLQVVSSGTRSSLDLVTAGTNVCTATVRVAAPSGIRTLACEIGTVPGAGQ